MLAELNPKARQGGNQNCRKSSVYYAVQARSKPGDRQAGYQKGPKQKQASKVRTGYRMLESFTKHTRQSSKEQVKADGIYAEGLMRPDENKPRVSGICDRFEVLRELYSVNI